MIILTYSNYKGGHFPYVETGVEGKTMEDTIEKLVPKTSTTALPETYTSDITTSEINGGKLDKKKLKDKLDLVKMNNPSTKLRKFINLKI